jgi:trehalose utilization protein
MSIRATVWNEFRHERKHDAVRAVYPEGIHVALADALRKLPGVDVRTATLDEPEHGLTREVLGATDVLLWWGHMAHHEVQDDIVDRVQARVLEGMGLVVLHSGHFSKIFKRLMGTTCDLKWRCIGERETLWVTRPGHPILEGIDDHFVLEREEMYGEFFDIPEPDETILISTFAGGECFRSGVTFRRGAGRIFYFRPGHETFPTYRDANVLRIIGNAVRWCAPAGNMPALMFGNREAGWLDAG